MLILTYSAAGSPPSNAPAASSINASPSPTAAAPLQQLCPLQPHAIMTVCGASPLERAFEGGSNEAVQLPIAAGRRKRMLTAAAEGWDEDSDCDNT